MESPVPPGMLMLVRVGCGEQVSLSNVPYWESLVLRTGASLESISFEWKDFLYQFENYAKTNRWSEKTMIKQLRFSLTGAAGAIIHENPRSACWNYQWILGEHEAAYGPCSEDAAAIGIELRQCMQGPAEALHRLRDDMYEKVSIVYADCNELEQAAVSGEIFINPLTDVDVVQKLLEEHPHTLAKAY